MAACDRRRGRDARAPGSAGRRPALSYEGEEPTYYALALLLVAGLLGMVVSGDLFNVFVFLEVASIASYALVASGGGPALAAAFRYVVLGTVGASFYLLGVGCLYALTGTLNMADLAARLSRRDGLPALRGRDRLHRGRTRPSRWGSSRSTAGCPTPTRGLRRQWPP